jgi:hypothetical protein
MQILCHRTTRQGGGRGPLPADHDDLVTRSLASLGEEAGEGAAERRKDRWSGPT